MWWTEWWVWGAFAMVLVILELIAPAYIFLGFGIGAGAMSLIYLIGAPLSNPISGSLAAAVAAFAVFSLIAWIALRRVLGDRSKQVKTFDEDINDH